MASIASLFLPLLLLASEPAQPGPAATLYRDSDQAASALVIGPGRRAERRKMINAAIQKNPRNSVALAHRAYLFMEGEDFTHAKRDFDAALESAGKDNVFRRNVLWSRGWANYDMGLTDLALQDWRSAEQLHGGHPYWVTYTYALAHWTLGEKELALQWFNATVDAMPVWGQDAGFEQKIRHWRPRQQAGMRELFGQWRQQQSTGTGIQVPASTN